MPNGKAQRATQDTQFGARGCTARRPVPVGACLAVALVLAGWAVFDSPPSPSAKSFSALAITNARLVTSPGQVIDRGAILIRDGRIVEVGTAVQVPPDADVLDASGLTVYPGFIDGATTIGVPDGDASGRRSGSGRDIEFDTRREALAATRRVDRKGIFPEYAIAHHLTFSDSDLRTWRRAGFTAAHVTPGDAVLAGTSALVLLADDADAATPDAIVRANAALIAGWQAPGQGYPQSLMGVVAHLRQTLLDAQHYQTVKALYADTNGQTERPTYDVALEALPPALLGRMPVVFPASSRDEIHRALQMAGEFGLTPLIQGGAFAYQTADRLARDGVPVLLRVDVPIQPRRGAPNEERLLELARQRGVQPSASARRQARRADRDTRVHEPNRAFDDRMRIWTERVANAKALADARVPFAITTLGNRDDDEFWQNLRRAIGAGLSADTALAAITTVPADLLGVGRELGSIEAGKIANLTLMDGDLAADNTQVRWVIVNGVKYNVREDDDREEESETNESGGAGEERPPQPTAVAGQPVESEQAVETDADRIPRTRTGGNVLIRNATVLTMTRGTRENTDLLVRNGVIAEIGSTLRAPAGVTVIDGTGAWVMPGIIDDHSHMAASSINESTLSIAAQVRIEDVLQSDDLTLYRAAAGGVTTANVLHGSANTIGGQRAIIQMKYRAPVEELLFPNQRRGIKFALGENVTRRRERFPNTRMGVEAVVRRAFREAQGYRRAWDEYRDLSRRADRPIAPPRRDLRLETLAGILDGEILVHSHGYNQDELFMLLRVLEDFGVQDLTLEHALEAYKIAPEIVRFGRRGAFVSTFADMWAYKVEAYDAIPYNVALITQAGGRAILNSDSDERVRRLYADAAKMVRWGGLSFEQALQTITLNPAMALQIDDRVGAIEVGKRADLALFNGHPLNLYARPFMTLVAGEVVFERPGPRGGPYRLEERKPASPVVPPRSPNEPVPSNAAGRYAIVNAEIHPVSRPPIARGTIVFEAGRIVAVGADVAVPAGATIVDAQGMRVYPGLIDGGSTLGLDEIGDVLVTQDSEESGVIQPDLRAGVAVKPDSELVPVARFTGITSAISAPEGGLVPGQAALIQLAGWTPAEMAYVDPLALVINVPEGVARVDVERLVGPGRRGRSQQQQQQRQQQEEEPTPKAQLDRIKALFRNARVYMAVRDRAGAAFSEYEPDLEALLPYLKREKPVVFNASAADDILVAIDLAKELDVRGVLRGCQDGWKVAKEIAGAGLPVILSPVTRQPSDDYDPYDSAYASAARLHAAGVKFAFQSASGSGARLLPFQAAMAVSFGLPQDTALRAVTLNAAEIFGVERQVGSLDPGKRADIIITDGDPLQAVTSVRSMFINGEPIDLNDNKHTKLYEKYRARLTNQR